VILWGSSYSASLVFLVAAEHPNSVRAVLAFSPGEYFDGPTTVRDRAAHVSAPIYVTSASDRGEIEAARIILAGETEGPICAPLRRRARFLHADYRPQPKRRGRQLARCSCLPRSSQLTDDRILLLSSGQRMIAADGPCGPKADFGRRAR
jgi:pimeloyl-ACP methyl ester carboxylesterase